MFGGNAFNKSKRHLINLLVTNGYEYRLFEREYISGNQIYNETDWREHE